MVDAVITPKGQLELLSNREILLLQSSSDSLYSEIFRNCALAVLSTGADTDDGHTLLAEHQNFEIELISSPRGVRLKLTNAPDNAFVEGSIIEGIRAHLFAVLRDIVFLQEQYHQWEKHGDSITDMVFKTLRHARALQARKHPNLIVCWGGHSINGYEYDYTKEVGYRLGLRGLDICTGCGIGAMKGPMKGATISHAKQRINNARYIGITEPGIIASEAPNAIVNELIIMPDIEKRLEAFVRLGHGIVVFPGGVGTAEEILYILGILLNEKNIDHKVPLIFTGPEKSKAYFEQMDAFIGLTLGKHAQSLYKIIIDNPIEVAKYMNKAMRKVTKSRQTLDDAYYFNWSLHIDEKFQHSFDPTHQNMAGLNLSRNQPVADLAADLRRAFSGIVAGNVKPKGIQAIKDHGCYMLNGDTEIMSSLDKLLASFIEQNRMKISGDYTPCYALVNHEAAN
ncbi:MAG: nucleotide 5'-monophosphate nucleosidase PpnN [Acidiferrobacterales bacterium]|nr:nucleotide 5'-monophosphate nucleosidase PpnN [Acidiferrobacterales bacterium]